MIITKTEAVASEDHFIHRIGSEAYFRRCSILPGESVVDFEEVDTMPPMPPMPEQETSDNLTERVRTVEQKTDANTEAIELLVGGVTE